MEVKKQKEEDKIERQVAVNKGDTATEVQSRLHTALEMSATLGETEPSVGGREGSELGFLIAVETLMSSFHPACLCLCRRRS